MSCKDSSCKKARSFCSIQKSCTSTCNKKDTCEQQDKCCSNSSKEECTKGCSNS